MGSKCEHHTAQCRSPSPTCAGDLDTLISVVSLWVDSDVDKPSKHMRPSLGEGPKPRPRLGSFTKMPAIDRSVGGSPAHLLTTIASFSIDIMGVGLFSHLSPFIKEETEEREV